MVNKRNKACEMLKGSKTEKDKIIFQGRPCLPQPLAHIAGV